MSDNIINADYIYRGNVYFKLANFYERDVFTEYNSLMMKLFCIWNKEYKQWECKLKKFYQISLYLENNNWKVNISKKLEEALKSIESGLETVVFRHLFDDSCISNNEKLFDYQNEDVDFFVQQNRSCNFNFFGLGKTLEAIALFSFFYMKKYVEKIFIFVIAGLSYTWKTKILKYSNQFKDEDIIICNNQNKLNILEQKDKKIFIIGYEFVPTIFCNHCYKTKVGPKGGKAKKGLYESKKSCFKYSACQKPVIDIKEKLGVTSEMFMICDESHKLMNPKGSWFNLINNHKQYFYFRHNMTATPFPNYFEQLWAQMYLVDESIINLDYKAFCVYIAKKMGDRYSPHSIIEYDDEKISKIMDRIMLWSKKRLKSDIKWFNKKKDIDIIYLDLDDKHKELYYAFCNYEFNVLKKAKEDTEEKGVYISDVLNKFPYISQVIDFPEMLYDKVNDERLRKLIKNIDFSKTQKMIMLKEYIEKYINAGEKLIVVDWRPDTLNYMNSYFGKKYVCETLHGSQKIDNKIDKRKYRQEIIDKFNDKNSNLKILFLSSLVGGTGFDLNYACSNMIFMNNPFDSQYFQQMQDRIYRINNENDVNIKIFVYNDTIDMKRMRICLNREKLNMNIHKNKILSKEEYKDLFLGLK